MADSLSGGTVSLPIRPDASGFNRLLQNGLGNELAAGAAGLQNVGVKIGKALAIGAGIALAAGIADVVKTGVNEAMDASAGQAQLEAGIKSTGGAAGVTTKQLESMASSLQGLTGQTDDSIVGAEQLLLTFTNIKNVGPDKIFNEATKAATDMAAKFGGDASSQAILLGKALNDPIKGITALTRVGVSFTQAQRDQIKAMVDAGNTIGAQKIILGELQTEFGGAAKAAGESLPGQLAIAKRSFEDFSQGIVETLLPAVMPLLKSLLQAFKDNQPQIQKIATIVAGDLTKAFHDFKPFLEDVGNFMQDTLLPAVSQVLKFLGKYPDLIPTLVAGYVAWTVAQYALNVAMDANPIGIVILLLAALATEITALATDWDGSTKIITGANVSVYGSIMQLAIGIQGAVAGAFEGFVNGIIDNLNRLVKIINPILSAIGLPKISVIGHVDFTSATDTEMTVVRGLLNQSAGISGSSGKNTIDASHTRALAAGGTIAPVAGGTLVRVAEAGRAETVVDTETLQRVANKPAGNITLVNPDPYVLLQMLRQQLGLGIALGNGRL